MRCSSLDNIWFVLNCSWAEVSGVGDPGRAPSTWPLKSCSPRACTELTTISSGRDVSSSKGAMLVLKSRFNCSSRFWSERDVNGLPTIASDGSSTFKPKIPKIQLLKMRNSYLSSSLIVRSLRWYSSSDRLPSDGTVHSIRSFSAATRSDRLSGRSGLGSFRRRIR